MELVSHPRVARPPSDRTTTPRERAAAARFSSVFELASRAEPPAGTRSSACHDSASYVDSIEAIDEPRLARRRHVASADDLGGGATRRRAARSRRSSAAASRSSGRPGTTRCRTARWASASSTTSPIAARYAQAELGLERVAIVDWDVHHGNGTEAIFRGDDTVLFVSLHQWPFYPGTGGPGTSDETTLNIPLAAGSGDDDYRERLRDAGRAGRARVRSRARARLGRLRRARGRSAGRHGGHRGRVPRAGRPLRAARAARRRRARRRLQPRDAAGARRSGARGLRSSN